MTDGAVHNTQAISNKQITVVKPSEKNFTLFCRYRQGESIKQIAESEQLTHQAVEYHINQVKAFLGDSWQKYVLTDAQIAYNRVKPKWEEKIDHGNEALIKQYYDKMVYPDRSKPAVALQLNVNNVVNDMAGNSRELYDSNVEVIANVDTANVTNSNTTNTVINSNTDDNTTDKP